MFPKVFADRVLPLDQTEADQGHLAQPAETRFWLAQETQGEESHQAEDRFDDQCHRHQY